LNEIDKMLCVICKRRKGDVLHHVSYFPEIKIRVCRKCHATIKKTHPELCRYTNEEYHRFYDKKLSAGRFLVTGEELNYMLKTRKTIKLGEIMDNKKMMWLLDQGELNEWLKEFVP